jgi:polar amino acid transport system permease protein
VLTDLLDAAPQMLNGIGVTLLYTVMGAIAAFIVAMALGLASMSPFILVRGLVRAFVEFFRGTSLVIQILWIVFVLPQLGIQMEYLAGATLALALNFGAYGSEIVRGAIASVPKAQWEATVALGLTRSRRLRRVILPQALPEMVPPFGNLLVQLLKSSSLLFIVGITELTFQVNQLRFELGSLTAFGIALVIYFVLAQLLVAVMRWWEVRVSRAVGRRPKPIRTVAPEAVMSA